MNNFIRSQVRFPPDLHELLTRASETNSRSLNEEIVTRLRATFSEAATTNQDAMLLSEIQQQLTKMKLSDLMTQTELNQLAQRALKLFRDTDSPR
ncbi:Arc family DNA-binding protein [Paraburkholderia sp. A2RI-6]|jgi:hypothetical protein|uniref:Arc family DNA-binding protein n=1 Tax=Paraburkholderia sp. A2RI-6 TaxID=3028371 RepID=UPI003B9EDE18